MANIAAGDRVDVTIIGSFLGQRCMSKFCYGLSSVTGINSQSLFFNALHVQILAANKLLDKFLACCVIDYVALQVWYQVISPARYAQYKKTLTGKVGGFEGNALTPNLAGVITRRGDLGNRKNVSSLHVPIGTTDTCMQDGVLTTNLEEALDALGDQMLAPIVTTSVVTTLDPVINNGIGATDFTPITDVFAQPTVRTMRRRNVGQGI